MNDFLIFIAPFIIIVAAIASAFWAASKDGSVSNEK
jgi:CydS-like protein